MSGLATVGLPEALQGANDAVEALLHPAVVGRQALPAIGLGPGDEHPVVLGLGAVDVEELGGGLEVGTGQAGVGVGAVLLWWALCAAKVAWMRGPFL